jgi:hypothetical protein
MAIRSRRKMRAQNQPAEPAQRAGGEQIDIAAEESIRLAHRALNRFPDLMRRHRYVAGGAAVAGALVVLASVAIARRMRQGQSAEEAAESVTQAEIESLHLRERDGSEDEEAAPAAEASAPGAAVYVPASNGASANGTNGATAHAAEGRASEG